eukprot:Opistho-2@33496
MAEIRMQSASDDVQLDLPNTQGESFSGARGVRKLDRSIRTFAKRNTADGLHAKVDGPSKKIVDFDWTSYGEVTFQSNKQKAQFVVVRNNARQSMEQAIKFLYSDSFNLEKPEFLISITGGAGNLDEFDERRKSQLQQLFTRAIARTAVDTSALIVTGGMHAGVMEYAGRAVSDLGCKTDLLGICVLKKFVGYERFVHDDHRETYMQIYYDDLTLMKDLKPSDGLSVLDANHSKFIIIDGDNWGDEIGFRLELEAHLASSSRCVNSRKWRSQHCKDCPCCRPQWMPNHRNEEQRPICRHSCQGIRKQVPANNAHTGTDGPTIFHRPPQQTHVGDTESVSQ